MLIGTTSNSRLEFPTNGICIVLHYIDGSTRIFGPFNTQEIALEKAVELVKPGLLQTMWPTTKEVTISHKYQVFRSPDFMMDVQFLLIEDIKQITKG